MMCFIHSLCQPRLLREITSLFCLYTCRDTTPVVSQIPYLFLTGRVSTHPLLLPGVCEDPLLPSRRGTPPSSSDGSLTFYQEVRVPNRPCLHTSSCLIHLNRYYVMTELKTQ